MTDKILVYSTCSSAEEAEKLARHLIENRLAACVSAIPQATSYYRWKGQVQQDAEIVLLIKSSRGLFGRLRKEWERLHSYEVPELIAVPIVEGAPNYLNWMEAELAPSS